jgi:protein-S-isoprenylcysteine O-methyltransferase Ste14
MTWMPVFPLAVCCWIILWGYWLVSARTQKAAKKHESGSERMGQVLAVLVCYILLFEPFMGYGWLGFRFVAKRDDLELAGLLITALGVAFAIWARAHLGANWSAAVSIRADHELIHTGPYRRIRHPIYTGMIMASAGTALVLGQVRGLIAVAIFLTAFYLKARKEERWLAQEFGDKFKAHTRYTGMFLPKFFRTS